MSDWERLADLAVEIEGCDFEGLQQDVSSAFTRKTTVIHLRGAGQEGVGEDVVYESSDQEAMQATGPPAGLTGRFTLASLSERLSEVQLFPRPPEREASSLYRVWSYESAALDLALRQAGRPLHEVLMRPPRPVTFVVSLRLGEPPTAQPVLERLKRCPGLRFKLDPTSSWDEALIAELADLGAVDSVDFKGLYVGSVVDQPADPVLYQRVLDAFPHAWIEDPALTPETEPILGSHRDRITWDAPIHGVADVEALPFAPQTINVKPSRLGGLRSLLDLYAYCEDRGIAAYGGGQFELGPGRGQIQYLASLYHPDTPNDVAPTGHNAPRPVGNLPTSPLAPQPSPTGFRWGPER